MSRIKSICLAMGSATIAILAVALAVVWFAATMPRQQAPHLDPPNFAARVQAAPTCESLKMLCSNLALGYDVQHSYIQHTNMQLEVWARRVIVLACAWAFVTAGVFFFVFWEAKRHERGQVSR